MTPRRWIEAGRLPLFFVLLLVLLAATMVVGIAVGSTSIAPARVLRVLLAGIMPASPGPIGSGAPDDTDAVVIWLVRMPRVLVAALVGAALGIAGAQMQGLFQNPMASPDVIATSSGAALGAVLAIAGGLAQQSAFWLPLCAFLGALATLLVVHGLTTRGGRTPMAMLLLAGVALNALVGAALSFVLFVFNRTSYEISQQVLFWLLGGLSSRTWTHVWMAAPCVLAGVAVSLFYARDLDLFLAGEETALSLGVEVERVKRTVLVTAALLTGAAVAVSGVVAFVGLIIPHIVRLLVGPSHRRLIPAAGLIGAIFLVLADLAARTIRPPEEIALGVITAACGAPFFLYLLTRFRREVGYL